MDLLVLWNLSRLVRRCLTNMVRAVLNCVDTSLIAPHTFASVSVSVSVSLSFTSLKRWIVFASQPFSRCPQCAAFSSTSLCASVLLLNTVCQRIHDLLCEDKKTEVVDLAMASECRGWSYPHGCNLKNVSTLPFSNFNSSQPQVCVCRRRRILRLDHPRSRFRSTSVVAVRRWFGSCAPRMRSVSLMQCRANHRLFYRPHNPK